MRLPAHNLSIRLLLAVAGGLFCVALYWFQWLLPLDRVFYDYFNELTPMPLAEDVVIVAVDEDSLAELGRWPWPRENHVQLFRELRAAGVQAAAVDILFAEPYPGYPEVDAMLAREMAGLGRVVLPVYIARFAPGRRLREMPPVAPLAGAAAALGHVHIEVDSDGVARTVFLQQGVGHAHWPHLTVALARVLGMDVDELPGEVHGELVTAPGADVIVRNHANLIPFMGPAGTVPRISYVDVMKGRADPALLRDRIVLVGATAAGHADNITTSHGQISGVEVNANIFQALRGGYLARPAPAQIAVPLIFALSFLGVLIITGLRPGSLLLAVSMGTLAVAACSFIGLAAFRLWLSPAPLVLTTVLAYPLWNWLRLSAAVDFIASQLFQLEQENRRLAVVKPERGDREEIGADPIERILRQVGGAYAEARYNHELVRGTLEQLASGVILAEPDGRLLLVNSRARDMLDLADLAPGLAAALAAVQPEEGADIEALLSALGEEGAAFTCEGLSRVSGRHLLLQGSVIALDRPLLLLVITDVEELKASEKRRLQALNFLSHDLRAPLTSGLALIQSSRESTGADDGGELLLAQIERYISASLSYAENFIQLARLEQGAEPLRHLCDAQSLLDNAVAQLYHSARARRIDLQIDYGEDDLWVDCVRDLVERALINLIDNALKHSPDGSAIEIRLYRDEGDAVFEIADRGEGVAPGDVDRIFEEFEQGAQPRSGVGLGLRFVATVAQLHGGSVKAARRSGQGSRFTLALPAHQGTISIEAL